jgi:hypothetical protein
LKLENSLVFPKPQDKEYNPQRTTGKYNKTRESMVYVNLCFQYPAPVLRAATFICKISTGVVLKKEPLGST